MDFNLYASTGRPTDMKAGLQDCKELSKDGVKHGILETIIMTNKALEMLILECWGKLGHDTSCKSGSNVASLG